METGHGGGGYVTRAKDFHAAVEAVVYDEIVGHAYTVGFHRVALTVVVVSYFRIVEVGDATRVFRCHFGSVCV